VFTRFLALKALRWGDLTKEAIVVVKVGVDFPAAPLIFLLDCDPPVKDAGDFSSIAFLALSSFFLSSSALATAF
jgi:hypothetical protein